MTKLLTPQKQQIKLMNQLYKLQHTTEMKKRTVILYDFFQNRKKDEHVLINLHTCARVILDQKIQVSVKVTEGEYAFLYTYLISPEHTSQVKVSRRVFEVEEPDEKGEAALDNIWIYEQDEGDLRVVVIPIQKAFIDIQEIRKETENEKNQDIAFINAIRLSRKTGPELAKAHQDRKKEKEERFQKQCIIADEKHLKMFKIEAFLSTVLDKTQQVSICSFVEISLRRFTDLDKFKEEFLELFSVPKTFTAQYIIHGWTPNRPKIVKQAQREEITGIFTLIDKKFGVKKFEVLNEKYFFPKNNIRTKIYQNMQKNDNRAIIHVVMQFVESWSKITLDSASCFVTVLRQVLTSMNQQKSTEDLNASMEISSSKEIFNSPPFGEIFKQYILPSMYLPTKVTLENFYTPDRLKDKIHPEKGQPIIPPLIENLAFCHFFYQTIKQFGEIYKFKQSETNYDQVQLLNMFKGVLKSIYQLIKAINSTFLSRSANSEFKCQDIQKFFDFLTFTLHSIEKIKLITKREISVASSLNALFQNLKPKKYQLLMYIIANQKDIQKEQPIHQYDLYLLIINQNSTKEIQSDMQYIYLHIHELKASCIAKQYIYDNEKLVEAIKSYTYVALKYKDLSSSKKKLFDIIKIESNMAHLLKIVGQQESAARIYMKNRKFELADKAYKQVMIKLRGDEKAENLIQWGFQFQQQFEYDLALSYYRTAFSQAESVLFQQQAIRHKFECNSKIGKEFNDSKALQWHINFIKEGDIVKYASQIDLTEMYRELLVSLKWDKQGQRSCIRSAEGENEDSEQSFFINLEKKEQ